MLNFERWRKNIIKDKKDKKQSYFVVTGCNLVETCKWKMAKFYARGGSTALKLNPINAHTLHNHSASFHFYDLL